jgi:hypothetical protein
MVPVSNITDYVLNDPDESNYIDNVTCVLFYIYTLVL